MANILPFTLPKILTMTLAFIFALASFIFASYMLIADFEAKTTRIVSEDRHASLDDVYFPSLVVCNINDFRYSFVNFLIQQRCITIPDTNKTITYQDIIKHNALCPQNQNMARHKIYDLEELSIRKPNVFKKICWFSGLQIINHIY